jgi:hypothetical protein
MRPFTVAAVILVVLTLIGGLAPPIAEPASAGPVKPTQVHIDTFADGSVEIIGEANQSTDLVAELLIPAGAQVLQASINVSRVRYQVIDIPLDVTPKAMWCGDLNNNRIDDDLVIGYQEEGRVDVVTLEEDPIRLVTQWSMDVPDVMAVIVDDLDRDNDKDIIVASGSEGRVYIFEAITFYTFAEPRIVPVGPRPGALAAGDLNPDYKRDIVVANTGGSSLTILQGRGDLTFYPKRIEVGRGPSAISVVDMDNDLNPDLVIAESRNDTVAIMYNEGNGNFSNTTILATGPGLVDADANRLNGDSLQDVVAICAGDDRNYVFTQISFRTFEMTEVLEVGRAPKDVRALQVNRADDTNRDIVTACSGSDNLTIYLAGGDLRHTIPINIPVAGRPVAVGALRGGTGEDDALVALCQMPPTLSVAFPRDLADDIELGFGPDGRENVQDLPHGSEVGSFDLVLGLTNYIERHKGEARFGQLVVHLEARATNSGWLRLFDLEVWVKINRPPRADAGRNVTVLVGEPAELNGSASYDPDAGSIEYLWLLPGDVDPSHMDRVSLHVFSQPGLYMILLVVQDPWGLQDQDVTFVKVNAPPVAKGTVPASVNAQETTRLSAHLSEDPDGSIVDYIWDYSQGVVHGRTVDVIFTGEGTWNVTLEVIDDDGARAIAAWQVDVLPSLVPLRDPAEHIPSDQGEVPGAGAIGCAMTIIGAAGLAGIHRRRRTH